MVRFADGREAIIGGSRVGAMSFIVDEPIEEYAERHTTPPDPLLAELAAETKATMAAPQMLTGPIEGRFLELLVAGDRARSGCSRSAPSPATRRSRWRRRCRRTGASTRSTSSRSTPRSPSATSTAARDGGKITLHLGPALETIE